LAGRLFGAGFPWGTLFVNLAGCFLIGVLFALADPRPILGPSARLLLMTGFLGGLTTFSTYALESVNFARSDSIITALANIAANNVLGLAFVLGGITLVRSLL
jgi:CrcB protein